MGLFVLALLVVLRFARGFLVPLAISLLLDFLFSPVIRWLRKIGIAESIGAGIVVFGLVAVVSTSVYFLANPAADWLERAPRSMQVAKDRIKKLTKPLEKIQATAKAVEEATTPGGKKPAEVQIAAPSMTQRITGGTTAAINVSLTIIFLTYFLLAVGDLFTQKLVGILPVFSDKKKAVGITREIEVQFSRYLSTVTVINICLGLVIWALLQVVGMPNAALWGFLAGLTNFVPYIGGVVTTFAIFFAALMSFEDTGKILLMPGIYLAVNLIESNLVTPILLGRRLPLNNVALFVGLLLWWYLWGIPGAILAVPMMVALKIVCDHVERLAALGAFLGP
ncbi:MAG TPA: AI-2E family transporter [Gemmatimonadales bacterium]|nr:AI-2E family transporter [Gemmatimonadales bacterium]